MKILRLFPLITLFAVGCKNDEPGGESAGSRPTPTVEEQAVIDELLNGQKIGHLLKGQISWFKEDQFQKGSLDRAPDLYLFYYTASW
ncbi:MAG: hypothetical protein QNL33_09310 [Akkermansiaceae bacterium]|jgi:hypothetical protein